MSRMTIDFGIDLGTTNSSIATIRGVDAEIIKSNDAQETTPSAIWIDRRNKLHVGGDARERVDRDPGNACVEFKLRMGTVGQPKVFESSGRSMQPEELSAEVLKSLRGDVRQRLGEEITAAVVTVPAAFDIAACDATRRAAQLAGLSMAPLMLEPTAAALAYGFQAADEDATWLVYDLGGGTFDAAVVRIRDGEFSVLAHAGDNFLGGKLIDWKVVDELLIPAVSAEFGFTDLSRGDPQWTALIAALKVAAEKAKIRLSRVESETVRVSLENFRGGSFDFECELGRADVERLAEPLLLRSLHLCRRALTEAGLLPDDIAKVILVGGPTLSPYVRDRLADPVAGLGMPLEFSQDPMTVVARGAAIFASTQRMPETALVMPTSESIAVRLEYQPVGPDTEPLVAGRLHARTPGSPFDGFTVELVNAESRPPWRSGRISVDSDGAFVTTVWAEQGRPNVFRLEVTDPAGNSRPVDPDRFTYRVGVPDTEPPLIHSIGIGLDGNEMLWLMKRGTPLPASRRVSLRTTSELQHQEPGSMIRIPVFEGEHQRADRNRRVGRLELTARQVTRDLPRGSEVELRLEIDASRQIVARAYVPLTDVEIQRPISLEAYQQDHQSLVRDAADERHRLDNALRRMQRLPPPKAAAVATRIEEERMIDDVRSLVDAARVDPDAGATASKRILDLKSAVDELEDALAWPELVESATTGLDELRELVDRVGTGDEHEAFADHERSIREAIDAQHADLLTQRCNELQRFGIRLLDRAGDWEPLRLEYFSSRQADLADPARAARLIAEGQEAAAAKDQQRLRDVNAELAGMLPASTGGDDPVSDVTMG